MVSATWMVRAGRGGENADEFIKHGVAALGWHKLGELSPLMSKADLQKLLAEKDPQEKSGTIAGWASMLYRFLTEVEVGDAVVTFDRERRLYFLGTIESAYEWRDGLIERFPQTRRVKWTHRVHRSDLSAGTRNSLGATQTLFSINDDAAAQLREHALPIDAPAPGVALPSTRTALISGASAESEDDLREEVVEKAEEFIEDALNRLDWKQMQELVAGILRAMGYRTTVSGPGADRGVDIFASPDGLGLQEPRIFVEVKHRSGSAMSSKEIRSFLGGRKSGDRCLYVSTGGFTKDAHYEADRASVPITLITLPDLRKLLIDHYEDLDAETRALVPLKRLYWPAV